MFDGNTKTVTKFFSQEKNEYFLFNFFPAICHSCVPTAVHHVLTSSHPLTGRPVVHPQLRKPQRTKSDEDNDDDNDDVNDEDDDDDDGITARHHLQQPIRIRPERPIV